MHRVLAYLTDHPRTILIAYLALYSLFGIATVSFYPSYAYPHGDEDTYLSWARNPWTLVSDSFEGYPPKQTVDPYNTRLFLNPFSLLFALFGFTYVGARLIVFAYGLAMLILTYDLGRCLGSRAAGLAATVLLSLSPAFLYLTHGIRPEGMFSLFILLCLWIILRCPRGPGVKTYAVLAFVSASMLQIHLNGVVMPLVFFVVMLVRDWSNVSGRRISAFLLGGIAFVVLYLLINFLPAIDTLKQYGLMPHTYVSESRIPFLDNPWMALRTGINAYAGLFDRTMFFEPWTTPFLLLFLPMALIALVYRPNRSTWCVAVLLALMIFMLLMVIPNRRATYLFYLLAPLFILALQGPVRLPRPWAACAVTALLTLSVAAAYLVADVKTLNTAWKHHQKNRIAEAQIRKLIDRLGEPGGLTVMASEEFHAVAHDTRFRSFHSLLETKDLERSFQQLRPDIVVFYPRAYYLVGLFILDWPGGIPQRKDYPWISSHIIQALSRQNYRPYPEAVGSTWNGEQVLIYYKPHGRKQAGDQITF